MHDKMIIELFTLLKSYGHNYRVDIACEQLLKSLPPIPSCCGSQWILICSPLANMRFTNGIHILDI